MISAMLLGHPAELPQRMLDALGQRLKRLGKAETDGLDVGIRQHAMGEQMRKGCPAMVTLNSCLWVKSDCAPSPGV